MAQTYPQRVRLEPAATLLWPAPESISEELALPLLNELYDRAAEAHARPLGLGFAGVDMIREKVGQIYLTEVNGNHGTGIIDITKKNHFVDLIKFVQERFKKGDKTPPPVPLPNED